MNAIPEETEMQGVSREFIEAITNPILGPFTEADTEMLDALNAYTARNALADAITAAMIPDDTTATTST